MEFKTMKDLFVGKLHQTWRAENELIRMLPDIADKASARELKAHLKEYQNRARDHSGYLEDTLQHVDGGPTSEGSTSIASLIGECDELLAEGVDPKVRDAAIIGLCQRLDHVGMAEYGTLIEYARLLELEKTTGGGDLEKSLEDMKRLDSDLNRLAIEEINPAVPVSS